MDGCEKTCKRPHPQVDSPDKTGHPVVAMANKRRICAGNSVLSTGIRVISVQRDLSAYRRRDAPEVGARLLHLRLKFSLSLPALFHSSLLTLSSSSLSRLYAHECISISPTTFARSQGKFFESARLTEGKDRRMAE